MKCPNCSFLNADDVEECKICGYALNPTPPSKSRYSLDDADLDKSVDALFGASDKQHMPKNIDKRFEEYANMPDEEDNSTITDKELHWLETLKRDMATVDEEFDSLRKETDAKDDHSTSTDTSAMPIGIDGTETADAVRHEYSEQAPLENTPEKPSKADEEVDHLEPTPEEDTLESDSVGTQERFGDDEAYDVINLNLLAKDPEKFEKDAEAIQSNHAESQETTLEEEYYKNATKRNRVIIILVLAVILFLIFFKILSGLGEPKPPTDEETTSNQVEEPAGLDDNMTSEVLAQQTGIFFGQLKAYVNDGNIAVLSRFENSQNALEQLNRFKNEGTLDDFRLTMPSIDDIDPLGTPITINVAIDRTISDKSVTREDTWSFNWVYIEEQWLIQSLQIQSQDGTTTVDNSSEVDNSIPPTDNTGTATSSPDNSTPTTSTIKPEGFTTTASFTGGIITDGQDISSIRFGRHDAFDRLVFDLSAWTGTTTSGESIEEACHYEAKISDDGKSITLLFSGARGASAALPNLRGSSYFSAISVFYPEDDSAVGFNITLNQSSAYKVFSLKAPGRIVVDVMPK